MTDIISKQDEQLDILYESMSGLKRTATRIGTEVHEQDEIIEELTDKTDIESGHLLSAQRRLNDVVKKKHSERCLVGGIVFMLIVVVVLVIVVWVTR